MPTIRTVLVVCAGFAFARPLVAQTPVRQPSPFWGAIGLGAGALHLKYGSSMTLATDISGGITLPLSLRVGVQSLHMSTIGFMSDQPAYSTRTLLGVARYAFVDWAAVSLGLGRMVTRDKDGSAEARNRIGQVGGEIWLPRGTPFALRLFGLRTWTLGNATWTGATAVNGNPTQTQFGLGILLH